MLLLVCNPAPVYFRCASLQEQLFLRAVIAEFRRLGLEEATFQQVMSDLMCGCKVMTNIIFTCAWIKKKKPLHCSVEFQ